MSDKRDEIAGMVPDRIRSGEYRPGRGIPSASEVADDEFGAWHLVVEFVIAELRKQGYVLMLVEEGGYVRALEDGPDSDHGPAAGGEAASG
jgi:DNA-binding transcriptional regulator YhcF (GntR family)